MRLYGIAKSNWIRFDGWATKEGIEPMQLPIDRFFNLLYFWCIDGVAQEEVDKFNARLYMPPVGSKAPVKTGRWAPEAETAALGDLAAALGSGR